MRYGIGVDVGGTGIKIGLFSSAGELLEHWVIETNTSDNGAHILTDIAKSVSVNLTVKGIDKKQVNGLGIGIPGPVVNGVVEKCVNLGWGRVEIEKELSTLCGLKVFADNDANAAALGEYKAGSGKEFSSIVFVTLGTGIGSGIIYDGKIIQGFQGYGGEMGHMIINSDETDLCNCGKCGCLEQYGSATGIKRITKKHLAARKDEYSSLREYDYPLTTREIFAEAQKGDAIASDVTEYCMDVLGKGLANVCHVINPEAVIIGGGVANAGDWIIDKIKTNFYKCMIYLGNDTRLILAKLGSEAGMYGAFYLIGKK